MATRRASSCHVPDPLMNPVPPAIGAVWIWLKSRLIPSLFSRAVAADEARWRPIATLPIASPNFQLPSHSLQDLPHSGSSMEALWRSVGQALLSGGGWPTPAPDLVHPADRPPFYGSNKN